ncbi:Integrase catalytic core [Arabidopsis thaliana x Arabidopsis arenosa]|uniref:Integrase catalytic core n=1 Tax=Arabidopsis thaliana x Arabidopsis arenosa TaxID=1240361 RepID=A0A8T1XHZ5_9BRAS|nr:Integrase catalytic core [Arabidopsis thaliana x Arabidopsis arenosa]
MATGSSDVIPISDSPQLLNVNMTSVTKLTGPNYLMWSRQVQGLLNGYDLTGYVDGTTAVPPSTTTVAGATTDNPAFKLWKRQDQLIYSALIGAISITVQPYLSKAKTSADIWSTLSEIYATPSRSHIQQVRQQIKQWTKGTKSIDEYFRGLTVRFDLLAHLGNGMEHEDQIKRILEGLPEDYKRVVDQIEGRDRTPSLPELLEKLLNHEIKLNAVVESAPSLPITANAAQVRGNNNNRNNNRGNSRFNPRQQQTWQQQQFQPQQDSAPRGYQGKCQICGIHGHSARRCSQLQMPSGGFTNSYRPSTPQTPWQPRAHMAVASPSQVNPWLLDSGATHHLTTDLSNLSFHQLYNGGEEVTIADGSGLPISHTGSTYLPTLSKPLTLKDVLYVPNIAKNLISVYRLCNSNQVSVEFFPAHFQVKDLRTGARLLQGRTKNELYEWPVTSQNFTTLFASPTPKASLPSWHSRLGHPSPPILQTIVSQFSLPCFDSTNKHFPCSHCLINKSHKLPFSTNTITSNKPLQYIYSDVWSSPLMSNDGFKYYLVLVDHYTRYTWLYPLKLKSQVRDTFIAFKALVENRFQCKIGTLYSDNGGEFLALRQFLSTNGISHFTSPPHTPEHNGISERKHRHIVETGLTLLHQASVPKKFWPYAFATAVYLINRMPTPVLDSLSPYAKLFGQSPNYLKLRVFGSLCFPWLRPYNSHKLQDKSHPCVFMGYSLTQSAYLCLDITSGRLYTSCHVQFVESTFPFASPLPKNDQTSEPDITCLTDSRPTIVPINPPPLVQAPLSTPPASVLHAPSPTDRSESSSTQELSNNSRVLGGDEANISLGHNEDSTGPSHQENAQIPSPSPENTNQAHKENQTTTVVSNPATTVTTQSQQQQPTNPPENIHPMQTRRKNNIIKPKSKLSLAAITAKPSIPNTVTQALRDEKWRKAMSEEIYAQIRNNTFDLVPSKPGQNVIATKWIFTLKYLPNGVIDSPVVKSITIRMVLQLAVNRSWCIRQLDVNNAFLQGTLQEEVYVSQPPGFIDKDRPHHVCRLNKALYGLKQAPRAWYQELKNYLILLGFKNSLADTSVFIFIQGASIVYTLVYVDDIIVTGSTPSLVTSFISTLSRRFSLKDPTDLTYFLGIEATRTSKGLHLMQRKYIIDLLVKTNMLDAKPVSTPMAPLPKLTLSSGTPLDDAAQFRMVLGSLQYLAFTRPDIAFVVNRLSQFMHRPTDLHWQAAKRILRYLAGTVSHGIFLRANTPMTLHAFSDADWAGDNHDYLSTNAYILYLGSSPIPWSSKKQKGVARSSTEAEYRAVANTASELRWVCSLLTELGVTLPAVPVIYCDNVGATYLCANPVFHSRMKHLALDYHFVRDNVQAGALRVAHVSTHDQLADALTKALPRPRFTDLFNKIGVTLVPPS